MTLRNWSGSPDPCRAPTAASCSRSRSSASSAPSAGSTDAEAVRTWKLLARLPHDTAPLREKFITGAAQESYSRSGELVSPVFGESTAGRVFDLIVEAVPRAFTAAHAHSYARMAFQAAWLKANWPEEFQQVLDRVRPPRTGRVKA